MIERYTRPAMAAVWSEEHRIKLWLRVEIAVAEAWHRRGRVPDWAIVAIRTARCDSERMRTIERETDHELIAFLRATGETVGEAARYIHLGLTSSDVLDTALALQVGAATALLDQALHALTETVARRAIEHQRTLTIGRTHGFHAEPTTFGLKLAVWYDELRRHRRRLDLARGELAVGKLSGAVGTHAHVPPALEEEVCAALGLAVEPASTQIVQRDRHAFFLSILAGLASSLEKFAVEVRHLQRTEVREVQEPFDPGNQGSSAMPHKRNPHASERVSGLARVIRGYAAVGLENVPLWHERDISHSSAERIVFPDACILLDYLLALVDEVVGGLVIDVDRMARNVEQTGGLVYSQQVLLALVDAGLDRQTAYQVVQRHALAAWDGGPPFREALASDPIVQERIEADSLATLFDPAPQLRHVDDVFRRLGLDGAAPANASWAQSTAEESE